MTIDATSIVIGLLGGIAIAGFGGWILSRWLATRGAIDSAAGAAYQSQQFASVAQQALSQNADQFLRVVRTELDGQFGREREALAGAVGPLKDSLTQVQGLVRSIEEERNKAYGSLDSELKDLKSVTSSLQHETITLSSALRNPQARGRWGEVALRRLVELAGLSEHCDFDTQVSLPEMEERLRPDLVVNLPAGRVIPVDSKVSVSAYLDALAATTDAEKQRLFEKHAENAKARLRELASKEYAEKVSGLGQSPEFTIMFIPGDDFLAAALTVDPDLFEEGASKKVMLASPSILLPLLRVVERGWRQERFLQSVEQLRVEARTLYDRLAGLTGHLGQLGRKLEGAVTEYNSFVGSYNGRVMPQARKFEEMGAQGSKVLPQLQPIDNRPNPPEDGEP